MKMIVANAVKVALMILVATAIAQDDTCTRYGFDIDLPGASCADIYNKNPTSHDRSGYYVLKTDHLFFAYCDMELDCGGNKGGWMRIADVKQGDTCPTGWSNYSSYCTGGSAAGCYSAHFSTNFTSYSKVCGKVLGYQKGTMDAFYPFAYEHGEVDWYKPDTTSRSLDGVYVDGISITFGNPRKHVWTYAVGLFCPICVYCPIRVWDIPYAYGTILCPMHTRMGVPYEYACIIIRSYTTCTPGINFCLLTKY